MNNAQPYLVVITTRAPYSTSSAIDALEAAIAATNIGINVIFIFDGDGVLQLLPCQYSDQINHKSTLKRLSALPLFDVENIYISQRNAEKYNIDQTVIPFETKFVTDLELSSLVCHAQTVLRF